jgi:hypothetical protein
LESRLLGVTCQQQNRQAVGNCYTWR